MSSRNVFDMTSRFNRFFIRLGVVFFLWLAFLLRVWGLEFGLPYEFHPDEHQYVDTALNWHIQDQLKLGFINPPLFIYLLCGAFWLWITVSPFEPTPEWISAAYVYARLWSVFFGVLTVALVFPMAKRISGKTAGLVAVVFMATSFLPARESHFAVNDTVVMFFVLLTIYFCVVLLDQQRLSIYLIIGVTIGLTTAAKLTGGLVGVALIMAYFFVIRSKGSLSLRQILTHRETIYLVCSLFVALIAFSLVSAHIFLRLPEFIETIIKHLQFGAEGYKGLTMTPSNGWGFYLNVLGWGLGWATTLVTIVVLLLAIWKHNSSVIVLVIYPVVLFSFMGAQKILFARFLLPAIPPLIILVAVGLVSLEKSWPVFFQHRWLFWPVVIGVLIAQPLSYLIWFNHLLTLPDTRETATQWFIDNFPKDTVIVKESYAIFPATHLLGGTWPYKIIHIDERGHSRNQVDHYVQHKTEFIAISNFTFDRVRAEPVAEEARLAQLDYLADQAELIQTFNPYRDAQAPSWFYLDELYGPAGEVLNRVRPGPLLNIYALSYENQPRQYDVPTMAMPVEANFDDKILLLGYDLPNRRVQPGETIPVTLYWQALTRMDQAYVIFTRVLDEQQQRWGGYDRWPQEASNTMLWHKGEVVIDTFGVSVTPDAPNGIYTIDIGLYNQADLTGTPLPILHNGQPIGQNSVRLGPVKVGGPPPGATMLAMDINPQHSLNIELGQPPVIALRGYDLAYLDQVIQLTLYWESLVPTSVDWSVFAHLRDSTNQPVTQQDGPAGGGAYPTSLWDTGEIIVDTISIPAPANPTGDQYQLVIGLYNLFDGQRLAVSDSVHGELFLTQYQP